MKKNARPKRRTACTTSSKAQKVRPFKRFPNRLFALGDENPIHQEIFNAAKKGIET